MAKFGAFSRLLTNSGVGVLGQDDVLDEGDAEELAGVFETNCHFAVLRRGL